MRSSTKARLYAGITIEKYGWAEAFTDIAQLRTKPAISTAQPRENAATAGTVTEAIMWSEKNVRVFILFTPDLRA